MLRINSNLTVFENKRDDNFREKDISISGNSWREFRRVSIPYVISTQKSRMKLERIRVILGSRNYLYTLGASVELDPIARPWHSWTHETTPRGESFEGRKWSRPRLWPLARSILPSHAAAGALPSSEYTRFDSVSIDTACLPGWEIKRRLSP